jgi:hypothetical protein
MALTYEEEARQYEDAQKQQQGSPLASLLGLGILGGGGNYLYNNAISPLFSSPANAVEQLATLPQGVSSGAAESLLAGPSSVPPYASYGSAADAGALSAGSSLLSGGGLSGFGNYGYLGDVGAALGAYNLIKNFGKKKPLPGALSGGAIGLQFGGPIGAGVGALAGGLIGSIKAGKHGDQVRRDAVRSQLQQAGFLDNNYEITLADGSTKFNMGLDGGARPQYAFSGGRRPYEVKTENPFSGQAVGWANPLANIATGGDKKLASDFAGYFANAAMSNASSIEGVRANILNFMDKLGLNQQTATQAIDQLFQGGKIDEGTRNAFVNGINTLISGKITPLPVPQAPTYSGPPPIAPGTQLPPRVGPAFTGQLPSGGLKAPAFLGRLPENLQAAATISANPPPAPLPNRQPPLMSNNYNFGRQQRLSPGELTAYLQNKGLR